MFCNISLNAQAVFLFRCDVFFSHRHELYFSVATARPCARVKSTFAVLRSVVFTLLITGKWRLFTAYSLERAFPTEQVCLKHGLVKCHHSVGRLL